MFLCIYIWVMKVGYTEITKICSKQQNFVIYVLSRWKFSYLGLFVQFAKIASICCANDRYFDSISVSNVFVSIFVWIRMQIGFFCVVGTSSLPVSPRLLIAQLPLLLPILVSLFLFFFNLKRGGRTLLVMYAFLVNFIFYFSLPLLFNSNVIK